MRGLILALTLILSSFGALAQSHGRHQPPVSIPETDNPFSTDPTSGDLIIAPIKLSDPVDPNAPAPIVVSLGDEKPILEDPHNLVRRVTAWAQAANRRTYDGYQKYHALGSAPQFVPDDEPRGQPLRVNLFSGVVIIAPVINSLTISPSSGSYGSGQAFTLTLQANQPVTVTGGTPTLTLNTTPSTTTASYCGGSGTRFLSFCYTSGANLASPLATTSAAYSANGATLSTAGGNLPTTALNSVAFGVNIVAASGPTVVGVMANPTGGTWPTNTPITVYVQFSGNITLGGSGSPTLNLNTSPSASAANCPVASGVYLICTYTVGSNTASPAATTASAISLGSSTIAGTGGSASLAGANSQTLTGLVFTATPACVGTQYQVSNSGSDSANGHPGTPWATPGHAQTQSYGPNDCLALNGNDAQGLVYVSGQTVTVTNVTSGTIHVKDTLAQPSILLESQVTANGSGSGSTGTYTLGGTDSQTVGSSTLPVFATFGQAFAAPTSLSSDGIACFSINYSTNVTSNSGNFTVGTYGGPTAALLSNSGCAAAASGQSALADINGVNATWNGVNLYANGQTQTNGLMIANERGSGINSVAVENSACVDMHTTNGNSNSTQCFWTQVDYNVTSVTYTGVTATGGSGPSSLGEGGISLFHGNGTVGTFTIQGFECKNFGGRNVAADTGACIGLGSTNFPGAGIVQYGFIHDIAWNVYQCGGMSGEELYQMHNITTKYVEIWNVRPSSWATGTTPSGGCDDDGYDNDGGSSSTVEQVYTHDNFGTGIYGWVNDAGTSWGPYTVRYSISINDGYGLWSGANRLGGVGTGGGSAAGCYYLYNVTVIQTGTAGSFDFQGGGIPACGTVANNIFAAVADGSGNNDYGYFYTNNLPGLTFKANAYVPLTAGTFRIYQWNGTGTITSLTSWQGVAPGGDTGATQASPHFLGTPASGVICGPGGTGANQPLGGGNQGPQPCPQAVRLTSASTAYLGTGYAVSSPGSLDYYGDAIPNGVGTGYNIGADGSGALYISPSGNDSTGNGTFTLPYQTLAKAQTVMRASAVKATYLLGGTYNLGTGLSMTSADDNETYAAYPGQTPIVNGQGSTAIAMSTADDGITGVTVNGITFENFTNSGLALQGSNWTVTNNTFTNITSPGSNAGCVYGNFKIVSFNISNNLCQNNTGMGILLVIGNGDPGWGGTSTISNNIILNVNTGPSVTDTGGIYLWNQPADTMSVSITNNIIGNFGKSTSDNTKGIYLDDAVSNVTATGNVIYGTGEYALQIHGGNSNVIKNNVADVSQMLKFGLYQDSVFQTSTMSGNVVNQNVISSTTAPPTYLWDQVTGAYGGTQVGPTYTNDLFYNSSSAFTNYGSSGGLVAIGTAVVGNPVFASGPVPAPGTPVLTYQPSASVATGSPVSFTALSNGQGP